ncbi:hypothetical protein EVAR_27107_1 [Eumeta japonica]|uniref:Uncharacterized protein n=1 Tax=Eumeta variegata TaxID=151549 RepID=A0A4C1VLG8_EUMVA|nr:hypothetical protein EVAR_27107_1 [Eumeta japonica]
MLAWSSGGGSRGKARTRARADPSATAAAESAQTEPVTDNDPDGETRGALLAGAVAVARRRHAIRIKRKIITTYKIPRPAASDGAARAGSKCPTAGQAPAVTVGVEWRRPESAVRLLLDNLGRIKSFSGSDAGRLLPTYVVDEHIYLGHAV